MGLWFRRDRPSIAWHGEKRERSGLGEIGNTPLVEIGYRGCATIFAKAEFLNPTGSHKDRAYLHMIRAMEADGTLKPGMTLVDYTTGNGGASLAFIGRESGYHVIAVMPENMTQERKDQIRFYGAELVLTPAELFVRGAREKAVELAGEKGRVLVNQSDNTHNVEAFSSIGAEILRDAGRMDAFVGAIGTGASISGVAAALGSGTAIVGMEAIESPSSFAAKLGLPFRHREHTLIGTGPGKVAQNTDLESIGHIELVGKKEIAEGEKRVRELKLWLGRTSAACLHVAKKIAEALGEGRKVAIIFYDAGWKYYSELPESRSFPLGRPETAATDRERMGRFAMPHGP